MKEMSDFGIFASRFQVNNETLTDFENAMRYVRIKENNSTSKNDKQYIEIIDNVLAAIVQSIQEKLFDSLSFENQNVVEVLKKRKTKTWPIYKNQIIQLQEKINSRNTSLSDEELIILNDIADAMDIECSKIFKRMRRFL